MARSVDIGRYKLSYPIALLIGAGAYLLAAELGLAFASLNQSVSPVWPASGLATALLLRFGWRFWPAIWLGAWLANTLAGGPVSALAIAAGNTLEALAGALLVSWLERRRTDSFVLARSLGYVLAAGLAPIPAAGIGTAAVGLAGLSGGADFIAIALTWWAGDALGILILAPALVALAQPSVLASVPASTGSSAIAPIRWRLAGLICAAVMICGLAAVAASNVPVIFLAFPLVLLAADWFGLRGGGWITVLIASLLLLLTAFGFGAFADQSLNERLLDAQIFIGALAFSALVFNDLHHLNLRMARWVFYAGCLLAAAVFTLSDRIEAELADARFGKVAEAATNNVRQRLEIYADSLHAGGAFFAASARITRRDWHAYADSLDLITRYPGINGIGVVEPVAPADVDRFIADTRRDDDPGFTIHAVPGASDPRQPNEDHAVIHYIEPVAINMPAIGLDLASEANRRNAVVTARQTGQPQISDPIVLVQDAKQRAGFLMFVPIFRPGLLLQTPEQQAAAFRGWIYAPFIAEIFFREALKDWQQQVEVEIFNGAGGPSGVPLFATTPSVPGRLTAQAGAHLQQLDIYGHHFTLRLWPGRQFPIDNQRTSAALGAGLALLATLVAALVANLQSLRERATEIATTMTEALARSNERFALAIAGSQDGIWDWDLKEGTIWTSARCRQMLGHAAMELTGPLEDWRGFMHPDDLRLTIEATRALVKRAEPHLDIVQRYRHRDGHYIHVHNRALATYDAKGRAIRIVGALTDITPLLQAEERLRTAISVMDSGFALFDAEDRLVLFNDGFLDVTLRKVLPDPTGHSFNEIFALFAHSEELTAVEALPDREGWLNRRIELHRNPPAGPFEIAWTDGRWMRVFERRLASGGTVSVWTDITSLKRAEQRLHDAIESINEGFVLLDKDLRIVMLNSRLTDMYPLSAPMMTPGSSYEDVLRFGAIRGEYDAETPEEIEAFVAHWMAIFQSDHPYLGEGRFRNGRWALVSHHRTSDGGYASLRADITAQKQREAELELARQQLEDRAAQLTRLAEDLDQARRIADEANRGKSRFLANTSHELRTPLTAILGFSDVMSSEIFGPIEPPIYREYIDLIHESGEHLLSLINDILDLSKIEAGKMKLEIRALSTTDLLRQSSGLMRVLATERGIDLVIDAAPSCPVLHGDERAARQIILNLLSNAIKFTPAGGRVTLAVRPADERGVEISVTDTGVGMTEDEADRALQLYVQVDSDVARMALGTGIGLPLVKALTELHGGAIKVKSRKHHGTTITITLPWQAQLPREVPVAPRRSVEPAALLLPAAIEASPGGDGSTPKQCVLVVEDNEINQSLITVILSRMGVEVDCAGDGLAGVEMAAAKRYDLIIMDVQMPRLDGIEATRRIRALAGETSQAPIIALTADAEGPQRERCLAAGMIDVLAKPIVPPLLSATVGRVLGRAAAPALVTS